MVVTGLIYIGWSGLTLFLLAVLFHIEHRRTERLFLNGLRSQADNVVVSVGGWLTHDVWELGAGTVRASFHYGLHRFLSLVRRLLQSGELYIGALALRNKRAARSLDPDRQASHLDLMTEHKKATKLSIREKNQLKKEMLEG